MKKSLLLGMLALILWLAMPLAIQASSSYSAVPPTEARLVAAETPAMEADAKKKLTFKERLMVKVAERMVKKQQRKAERQAKKGNETKEGRKVYWANIASLGSIGLVIIDVALILSGILALAGIVCAIIFGAMGMKKSGEDKEYSGKGMGIAGFVAGIIGAIYLITAIVFLATVF